MSAAFAQWQPRYAEHGLATFPVRNKKPAVSGYLQLGLRASTQLAMKFPDSDAFGFALGARSRITVLDVDTSDEKVLTDALDRHGQTPLIIRSASGNFHAYYRHHGECRRIRPDPRTPIDILGGGFVVAPPSRGARGPYEFIQGGLDDLERLPVLRGIEEPRFADRSPRIGEGRRNTELWRHCMSQARNCDDLDALLDAARTLNERGFDPRLNDAEVIRVAASAWGYEKAGENRMGGTFDRADEFIGHDDAFFLLKFLRQHNGSGREFMIANGLAAVLRWPRKKLSAARRTLIDFGCIRRARAACQGHPAVYCWIR